MGTPAAFEATANAAIISGTGATVTTVEALSNDFSVAAGVTLVRGVVSVVGETPDANNNNLTVQYSVDFVHHLADPNDEDAYLHGSALVDQAVVMVPSFWRGLAGVLDVIEAPGITLPPERTGNIIEYNVSVLVSLTP